MAKKSGKPNVAWETRYAPEPDRLPVDPEVHRLLVNAISEKRMIRYALADRVAHIAEPHLYGRSSGVPRLLVYVAEDGTQGPWRLLDLPDVVDIEALEQTFPGKRAFPARNLIRTCYFATAVSDVSADRVVLHPDMEHLYWPGHEGEKMNDDFGGHSGGPVYRVVDASVEEGEPVDRLELVGFIYQRIGPAMLARAIGHLAADGSIIRRAQD